MATRIQLESAELARVRFAISPVYETVMAVAALERPGVPAVHLPWVRWARTGLSALVDLDLLFDLVRDDTVKPAFLIPPPDSRMPDFEHELRRVRATPNERVRADLDRLRVRSSRLRRMYADPRGGVHVAVHALRACHEALLAPHWDRMSRLLQADIGYRSTVLAAGGVERLFADLHDEVDWRDGVLTVHPGRPPRNPELVKLRGHGLVLCPSVFCWPRVAVRTRPEAEGTLRYPVRGVGTLWERADPAPDALAALIGRTRAAILVALAHPATTSDLATRLDVTAGAISQHLNVLRAAGLVNTMRHGRLVLHARTDRGDALVD